MRLILGRPVSLEVKKEVDNAIKARAQPKQEAPSVVMAKDAIEAGVRGIEELRKVSYVPMLFILCIFINFQQPKGPVKGILDNTPCKTPVVFDLIRNVTFLIPNDNPGLASH